MSERKIFLRTLYTIDGSVQYILARSLTPVSITFISREEDSRGTLSEGSPISALYASVSLKTCLETIRRSSPELMQDPTLDYSLYVLDPLETNSAPAPVNISNTHGDTAGLSKGTIEQPGVAVGLGLMSWALMTSDRDSICVTGTLGKQHTGQETLEVIFALRKTLAVKERAWDVPSSSLQPPFGSQGSVTTETSNEMPSQWYSTSHGSYRMSSLTNLSRSVSTPDLTREPVASVQVRSKAKTKAPKAARYSNTPVTESDKLMSADTYIGPLKKKGRPKATNAASRSAKSRGHCVAPSQVVVQKEVIVLDASDNENDISSSQTSDAAKKKASQQPRPPPFTTAPLIRHQSQQIVTDLPVKTEKGESTLPDLLSLLSSASFSADSTASKAALLATLTTIDSTQSHNSHENPQNSALIAALKQLLAIYTQPSASSKPTTSLPTPTPEATVRHLLPSSSHSDGIIILDKENVNPTASRRCHGKNGLDKFSDPLPFALNTSKERSIQSLRPSTRTNEIDLTNVSKESVVSTVRKRTLSDFMDERESGRKTKGKERETIKRHDLRRDSSLQRSETLPAPDGLRHYPKTLVANLPRPGQPASYYRTPSDPWTSPARGRPDNTENVEGPGSPSKRSTPRKHRMVSASSPVRGKDACKKYVVPEWARTNTATMPRLSEEARRAMEEAEARKREERNAARRKLPTKRWKTKPGDSSDTTTVEQLKPAEQPSRPQFFVGKNSDLSQGPISASSDGPVIAFPLILAARPSSPPLLPVPTPKTPKTPSKSRLQFVVGEEDGSLFTPIAADGSLFGSAASRGSIRGTPPSFLTSPLGNRKKVRISPTQSGSGTSLPIWSSSSSPKGSTDSVVSEEHVNSNSGKEAEETLDDLDCPPGSLPIASSDIDVDWSYSQSTGDDDGGEPTIKQHWAGLPPSSPPPPSSPMLIPEIRTDDEDMDELPIATSDSEVDDLNMFDLEGPFPNAAWAAEVEAERSMDLTDTDFTALFSVERDASLFPLSSSTTLDLFEQYTNLNAQSDDISVVSAGNDDVQTMFQNGIGNLDFTEFWETFKPMVDENTQPFQGDVEHSLTGFFGMENTQTLHGDVDHGKLAGEIQSLLGGFLV